MADYRRYFVPGGSYFFTVVTRDRAPFLCQSTARRLLSNKMRACQARWPYSIDAVVLLPDHLHCIWSLPRGDADYSTRWAWIKKEFTKGWLTSGGKESPVSESRKRRRDHGVWQPRFWEHLLRDEHDFERHFDYIHYNPVKHGLTDSPRDWPYSSFHRWVRKGLYSPDWGRRLDGSLRFDDLNETAME